MWHRHWSLNGDPFDDQRAWFVATPAHEEAVARLVHTIESAGRSIRLVAGAGLGKSRILNRALELTRDPSRRIARIAGPSDGADLFARLSVQLGARPVPDLSRPASWRVLADCIRLCRWQGLHVVLAVDDCHEIANGPDRQDLERLNHLDLDPSTRLTVILVGRNAPSNDWRLSVRLDPLTRSETAGYLTTKLEALGRSDPTFTPRAITRLHARSGGIPRGINRIAGLALMASALRGLEIVSPEVVEEVARDYVVHEGSHPDR